MWNLFNCVTYSKEFFAWLSTWAICCPVPAPNVSPALLTFCLFQQKLTQLWLLKRISWIISRENYCHLGSGQAYPNGSHLWMMNIQQPAIGPYDGVVYCVFIKFNNLRAVLWQKCIGAFFFAPTNPVWPRAERREGEPVRFWGQIILSYAAATSWWNTQLINVNTCAQDDDN